MHLPAATAILMAFTSTAATAQRSPDLEVLGVRVSESKAAVERRLAEANFTPTHSIKPCTANAYHKLVDERVKRLDNVLYSGELVCTVGYRAGENRISASYLQTEAGPVLYELEYTVQTGESFEGMRGRLQAKFGRGTPPSVLGMSMHGWLARDNEPYGLRLSLNHLGGSAVLALRGPLAMEEALRRQAKEAITARMRQAPKAAL